MTKERKKYKKLTTYFKKKYMQRYNDIIYGIDREISNILFNELFQEIINTYGINSFYKLRDSVMNKIKNDDPDEFYRLLNR